MSTFGTPQSRSEAILQNMLGAHNQLPPPYSRIEVLLMELLDVIDPGGGGGSSLPSVTTDDNGKVLTVVEGAWTAATLPNGTNTAY